jgi:hypothetical protein
MQVWGFSKADLKPEEILLPLQIVKVYYKKGNPISFSHLPLPQSILSGGRKGLKKRGDFSNGGPLSY